MKTAEQEYRDANEDNAADNAYQVDNNQLSVRDLLPDFDVSLLSAAKQKEFTDFHGKANKTPVKKPE